jgi:hypothetical protein
MDFPKVTKKQFKELVSNIRDTYLDWCVANNETHFDGCTITWGDLKMYPKKYQGELEIGDIQNSQSNRDPSILDTSKKLPKKLSYALRIMGGNSSFNFLPLGMLDDTIALQAEDRGHEGTILFFHYEKSWPKSIWKKVQRQLDSELPENDRTASTKLIAENLSNKLKDKKITELSLSEVIPSSVCKKQSNTNIPIQIKVYPNRAMHRREILGINNSEDSWTTHQKGMLSAEITLDDKYGVGNDYMDTIYSLVEGDELFQGEKTMFSRHNKVGDKMERFEEEIIMLWNSSRKTRTGGILDIYRGFDCSAEKRRIKQYEDYVKATNKTDAENEASVGKEFLNWISECVDINTFENNIEQVVNKHNGSSTTNINDLSMTKVDSALMIAHLIDNYIKLSSSNPTKETVLNVTGYVLQMASDLILDSKVQNDLIKAGTGANGRYNKFYSILEEELKKLPYETISDVKSTLISMAKQSLDTSLNPNGDISMIDRNNGSKSEFKIVTVNISNGVGLDKGHKNSGKDGKDISNFFLQFSGDNRFHSNKRNFIPSEYSLEYLNSIKEFMNTHDLMMDDDWQEAYQNTRKFVQSVWK